MVVRAFAFRRVRHAGGGLEAALVLMAGASLDAATTEIHGAKRLATGLSMA